MGRLGTIPALIAAKIVHGGVVVVAWLFDPSGVILWVIALFYAWIVINNVLIDRSG